MEQAWIGKVMFVGLIFLVLWGASALFSAKGEMARRARLAVGGALALVVAWVVFMMAGPVGFIITAAIVGAITWVVRGAAK